MKFLLNGLRDFIEINLSTERLVKKLIESGFEVEEVTPLCEKLEKIYTGKINRIEKHPNADRLRIIFISDGTQDHKIVTGAQNVQEGDIVPFSVPGSILADGTEIKASKLRGVDSFGMLCSTQELGLSESADGVWILPPDTPAGVDFINHAKLKDTLLDISILPNRGDCQSFLGLAREIAAFTQTSLEPFETQVATQNQTLPTVKIENTRACPFYSVRKIGGFSTLETPLWMQIRLERLGYRPKNLLVDVTNYVMVELGQPLHAFDAAYFKNNTLTIREAKNSESLALLDETDLALKQGQLLITEGTQPVALAGIMGGKHSAVSDTTTEILLESAYFLPSLIRITRTQTQKRTESAIRFERGVDPNTVLTASDRAAYWLQTLAKAWVSPITKVQNNDAFINKDIAWEPEKINALLGTEFSHEDLINTLKNYGFTFNNAHVSVPSYRQHDVSEYPCLTEEIMRSPLFESENQKVNTTELKFSPPKVDLVNVVHEVEPKIQAKITAFLIHSGFHQMISFPMISPQDLEKCGLDGSDAFVLKNPLTPEASVMQPSVIPNLLKSAAHNQRHFVDHFKGFEWGKTYLKSKPEEEPLKLGLMAYGNWQINAFNNADKATEKTDFFHLKGLVEQLFETFNFPSPIFKTHTQIPWHPGQSAAIYIPNETEPVGHIGFIHPAVSDAYECTQAVAALELNLNIIALHYSSKRGPITELLKYPVIRRDLALLCPKTVSFADIKTQIENQRPQWLKDIRLFDVYESEQHLGPDKKSMALSIYYSNPEATLTDDEVNHTHTQLCQRLCLDLKLELR